jgi:TetR/AcrR family transcriptional repressor of mexJK operon
MTHTQMPEADLTASSRMAEKPKRERRLSPDARRDAIMRAAKDLFLNKGYATTSLEEIVAVSGGSLSTVYQLFGSKQGLWEALVAQVTDVLTAPLHDGIEHHGEPRTVLKEYGLRLDALERSRDVAGALRLILAEGNKYPELARTLFARGPDVSRQIVMAYLNAEVANGRLAIDDVNMAVELFRGLVCGDTKLRNACGVLPPSTPEEINKRLDAAVDMFLKVYGA